MSLKFKIALFVSGLLLFIITVFTAVLLWSERRVLTESALQQGRELADGLGDVCRGAVLNQQDLLLANYLKRLRDLPEVKEAMCLDLEGRILGDTDVALVRTRLEG